LNGRLLPEKRIWGNTDAFDIYGNGFEVEELKEELARIDYPKVDWGRVER
jgi:hypothetical protein